MKTQRFEYRNKDVPLLKKDSIFRFVFCALFVAIFVWQFAMFVISYNHKQLTFIRTAITVCVLISTLTFALICLTYAYKSFNTMQKVILHGSTVRNITIISTGHKNSFLKLYYFITTLISFAMLIVLSCALTYNILQYVYFTTFSYYLPLLMFVAVAGFNSVYHIRTEIKTIQNVSQFNNLF